MTSCSLIGLAKSTLGLAYPVLVLCAPLLEKYSHRCIPYRWNLTVSALNSKTTVVVGLTRTVHQVYRFWTGIFIFDSLLILQTFAKEAHIVLIITINCSNHACV